MRREEVEALHELSITGPASDFDDTCMAVLPQLISTLENNAPDGTMVALIAHILEEFSFGNAAHVELMGRPELLALFASLMHAHLRPEGLGTDGSRASSGAITVVVPMLGLFVNLSAPESQRPAVAACGAVLTAVEAMRLYPTEADVQKLSCMLIRNVALDNRPAQELVLTAGGVGLILETLTKHPTDVVLEQAVAALLHLSQHVVTKETITASNGVPALLSVLAGQHSDVVLEEVGAVLVGLSLHSASHLALVEAGAVRILCTLMRLDTFLQAVGHRCMQVIGNLACNEQLRYKIGQEDNAMAAVINAMARDDSVKTARIGSWAILNIITNNVPAQERLVQDLNGVEVFVELLQTFRHDATVSIHSCKVLWNLSYSSREVQEQVAEEGMLSLLEGLHSHPKHTEIGQQFTSLLVNLTLNETTHRAFLMEDGVGTVVDAMESHSTNAVILTRCCRILLNVVVNPEVQREAVTRGAVAAVVTTILRFADEADLQTKACKTLAALAKDNEDVHNALALPDAMRALVQTAEHNFDKPDLLKHYLGVLYCIAATDATHQSMVKEGVWPLLINAVRRYPTELDVQLRAAHVMGCMLHSTTVAVQLADALQHQEIESIVDVMHSHYDDGDLQAAWCWALSARVDTETRRREFHRTRAMDAVIGCLLNHSAKPEALRNSLVVLAQALESPFTEQLLAAKVFPPDFADTLVAGLAAAAGMGPDPAELPLSNDLADNNHRLNIQELFLSVIGNVAGIYSDRFSELDASGYVVATLERSPNHIPLQVAGLFCLCRLAIGSGDWRRLDELEVVALLVGLLRLEQQLASSPTKTGEARGDDPVVLRATLRAVRGLCETRAGADRVSANHGAATIAASVDPLSESTAACEALRALALLARHVGAEELRRSNVLPAVLGPLVLAFLTEGDLRSSAACCMLVAELVGAGADPIRELPFAAHELVELLRKEYATADSIEREAHDRLRLLAGYALCRVVLRDPTFRMQIKDNRGTTDAIIASAQELGQQLVVQQAYGIQGAALTTTLRDAIDVLLDDRVGLNRPTPEERRQMEAATAAAAAATASRQLAATSTPGQGQGRRSQVGTPGTKRATVVVPGQESENRYAALRPSTAPRPEDEQILGNWRQLALLGQDTDADSPAPRYRASNLTPSKQQRRELAKTYKSAEREIVMSGSVSSIRDLMSKTGKGKGAREREREEESDFFTAHRAAEYANEVLNTTGAPTANATRTGLDPESLLPDFLGQMEELYSAAAARIDRMEDHRNKRQEQAAVETAIRRAEDRRIGTAQGGNGGPDTGQYPDDWAEAERLRRKERAMWEEQEEWERADLIRQENARFRQLVQNSEEQHALLVTREKAIRSLANAPSHVAAAYAAEVALGVARDLLPPRVVGNAAVHSGTPSGYYTGSHTVAVAGNVKSDKIRPGTLVEDRHAMSPPHTASNTGGPAIAHSSGKDRQMQQYLQNLAQAQAGVAAPLPHAVTAPAAPEDVPYAPARPSTSAPPSAPLYAARGYPQQQPLYPVQPTQQAPRGAGYAAAAAHALGRSSAPGSGGASQMQPAGGSFNRLPQLLGTWQTLFDADASGVLDPMEQSGSLASTVPIHPSQTAAFVAASQYQYNNSGSFRGLWPLEPGLQPQPVAGLEPRFYVPPKPDSFRRVPVPSALPA